MSEKEPPIKIRKSLHRLDGKVAIVTGSTSGIGEAIARVFAAEGAKVVVTGRRVEKGTKVAREINEAGGQAIYVQVDVTHDDQLQKMVDATLEKYGQIDILVNNAGRIIAKNLLDFTNEDWDSFVALDARSYFKSMQMVIPHMEARKSGSIINVTSIAAIATAPDQAIYGFVKAGVTHMTKNIALEYARKGIRVNALVSGLVLTEMIVDDPHLEVVTNAVPMGRIGTADEQAYAALFLASDEASFVTGSALVVDGGGIRL